MVVRLVAFLPAGGARPASQTIKLIGGSTLSHRHDLLVIFGAGILPQGYCFTFHLAAEQTNEIILAVFAL